MAKTVEEGFLQFHGMLTPTYEASQAAKSHRSSIKKCLEDAFEVTRFVRTGSFGNGTSIRGYSDVDYFACIPTEKLKRNSDVTLQEVLGVLRDRFPKKDIVISAPAIKVRLGTNSSESMEVVPADLIEEDREDNPIYEIPDRNGGWMRSSPDAHNKYVYEVNKMLDGRVKPLVSLLKAWKYYQKVPINSFYLEMRVAKYAYRQDFIDYSCDMSHIFQSLWDIKLDVLKDPKSIAGSILPCSSQEQKIDALSKLEIAFTQAQKARNAEEAGKIQEAFYWWNLVFAMKFPSYN